MPPGRCFVTGDVGHVGESCGVARVTLEETGHVVVVLDVTGQLSVTNVGKR